MLDFASGGGATTAIWISIGLMATIVAIFHAGNGGAAITVESKMLFWFALATVGFRVGLRIHYSWERYSWWGNLCFFFLALATARMLYEVVTGRPAMPRLPEKRKHIWYTSQE